MNNEKLMARLAALPAPDFMHAHKLSDPIGSGASYRADTVARLIDEAVAVERERLLLKAVPMAEAQSHNGEYSVGYSRGWNAACAALRQA